MTKLHQVRPLHLKFLSVKEHRIAVIRGVGLEKNNFKNRQLFFEIQSKVIKIRMEGMNWRISPTSDKWSLGGSFLSTG